MKYRIFLAVAGVLLVFFLFVFGRTEPNHLHEPESQQQEASTTFNINDYIAQAKQQLSPSQVEYVNQLENSITRGDLKTQSRDMYAGLIQFWKDSANSFVPYAYYLSEAAKLDKSQKNLTFAAQLILDNMRREDDPAVKSWESIVSADLFREALALDPENDDLKIGLGSSYVYGQGMGGNPQETMKGIQQLLEVVRKDSSNMKAQMVLGIGAVLSGQNERAIDRLTKVVAAEPQNIEAVSWLADAYAATGDKGSAIKWYEYSKNLLNNPDFARAIDERIKSLNGTP